MAKNRTKPSLAENPECTERVPIEFEGKGKPHFPVSELQVLYAASPELLKEAILAAHGHQRPASLGAAIARLRRRTQGAHIPHRAKRAPSSRKQGDPPPASLSPGQATRLSHHYPFVCALLAEMRRSAS